MKVQFQLIKIDAPIMVVVSLGLVALLWDGTIGRVEGAVLFGGLIAYTAGNIWLARRTATREVESEFAEGVPARSGSVFLDWLFILGGLGILVIGARLLTDNSVALARSFGVSEAVIGLTIVAAGTSVPELAASIVAAMKKEPDIALGNVIGSNIFNILGILGIASLLAPLSAPNISHFDLWTMVAIAAALVPMLWTGLRVSRAEGAALFAAYCGYVYFLWPK
jgi:cation:H+ antiporter